MARTLVTTCDRCNKVILTEKHIVVETRSSEDRRQILTKDDLCNECVTEFENFMTPEKRS